MKSKEKLWDICLEIYRTLYKEADPSEDFDEACAKYGGEQFYDKYYLDNDRQYEILNEICKKYKCTKREKCSIELTVMLGAAPLTIKERVKNG